MKKVQILKCLIGGFFGFYCLTAFAETYPEPEKESYPAIGLKTRGQRAGLVGKVVEVKFNRIFLVKTVKNGMYTGELRSKSKPKEEVDQGAKHNFNYNDSGLPVQFSTNGLGVLSKFITKYSIFASDKGSVYVLIGDSESIALGDRYTSDGEYVWSGKAKIPDMTEARSVSVIDLWLYSDQLNGKVMELEFYNVHNQRKGGTDSTVTVRDRWSESMREVVVEFPLEGLEFFEELDKNKSERACKVYVTVDVSSSGEVSVKALGCRRKGKGDDATYTW